MKKTILVFLAIIISVFSCDNFARSQSVQAGNGGVAGAVSAIETAGSAGASGQTAVRPPKPIESPADGERRCLAAMRYVCCGVELYLMDNPGCAKISIDELVSKKAIKEARLIKCPAFPDMAYILEWSAPAKFDIKCPGHGKNLDEMIKLVEKSPAKFAKATSEISISSKPPKPPMPKPPAPVWKNKAAVPVKTATGKVNYSKYEGTDPFMAKLGRSTNLLTAVKNGDVESAKEFIREGVSTDIRNEEGKTILQIATEKGYTEIADMLRAAGHTR